LLPRHRLDSAVVNRPDTRRKSDKFRGVQALRAVAALLVVFAHSAFIMEARGKPFLSRLGYVAHFGTSGVDIFFAISGFVISLAAEREPAWLDFLMRRVLRIFPLYWLLNGLQMLLLMASHRTPPAGAAVRSFLLLPHLYIELGWTLGFEMLFYLALTLMLAVRPRRAGWGVMAIFACSVTLWQVLGTRVPGLNFIGNPIIVEFLFGVAIGMAFRRYGARPRIGVPMAFAGAVWMAATIVTGYGRIDNAHYTTTASDSWSRVGIWGVGAALLVGGVVLWAPAAMNPVGRLFSFLGDASYSIYLSSWFSLQFVAYKAQYFATLGLDMGILLSSLFAAICGVLLYWTVEKPMTERLQRWWKRVAPHALVTA